MEEGSAVYLCLTVHLLSISSISFALSGNYSLEQVGVWGGGEHYVGLRARLPISLTNSSYKSFIIRSDGAADVS